MNASHITIITNAFAAMATAACKYSEAATTVRELRAKGLDEAEVRELCQKALKAKVPGYSEQVHETSGKPMKGSAYQRAVSRMMADTNPLRGESVGHAVKKVRVAVTLQAAIDKLVAQYGKAAVREGVKRVQDVAAAE